VDKASSSKSDSLKVAELQIAVSITCHRVLCWPPCTWRNHPNIMEKRQQYDHGF